MPNYAIYLRKSRADYEAEQNGSGETLARHRAILTKLAARNHHPIGQIYAEVVSGETINARPQVQALIRDISAGMWQGVYVMEVERLARGDTMDQGLIAHAFKSAGTHIITPAKTYNPADPSDEEYFEFSLFMSRREYKTITRRMQGGRVQSVTEGKYIGSRPAYGYRKGKIEGDKGNLLTVCEPEAAVVRQIFDWYLHGSDGRDMGLTRIASRLIDLHTPTGAQGTTWMPCRIHRILTNPVYIGMIQWGKDKTIRTVTPAGIEKKRVVRPQGDLYKGLHEPIIDAETYNAVQDKLHQPRAHLPVRIGSEISNPLAGLVYCSVCGLAMLGIPKAGRLDARIKCRTHGCPTVQNYREPVERAILQTLREWLDDAGAQQAPPTGDSSSDAHIAELSLAALQTDREKLLHQIDKLQDLVEQDVYTIDQYNSRYAQLNARLTALDADVAALRSEIDARPVYYTHEELRPAILHLLERYDSSTPAERNAMLKTCISRVDYTKTKKGYVRNGVAYTDPNQFNLDIFPLLHNSL